ncbi:MAG: HAMP domain-containing protein [Anaerolineales bacterium]|nr:HAMP domain-containing protein [Anaerolineales bacterium]
MSRLSIRLQLLLVFMVLFTIAFAGVFLWFHRFATELAMDYLRQSLMTAAETAASLIDADELIQVYETGVEEDAQYNHIAEQLRTVRDGNALIASVYTMVRASDPNELIFVVEGHEVASERAHLGDSYDASTYPEMLQGFDGPAADTNYEEDEYGNWLSGYAPIRDATGTSVAIVGVDMTAEDVIDVQNGVRNASILAFAMAYGAVFLGAYFLSGTITRSLSLITRAAQVLEDDEPFDPAQLEQVASGSDEIGQLARVFSRMAIQIQARENQLKQQVTALHIEIDEIKRQAQVAQITENTDFEDLRSRARELRRRREEEAPNKD